MNVIARFVRFVVWVLVLSWIFRLLGRLAVWAMQRAVNPEQQSGNAANGASRAGESGASAGTAGEPRKAARQLVRDPVCGMHLAETLAIPFRDGGELMHFCSADCRDKYANRVLQRAANG